MKVAFIGSDEFGAIGLEALTGSSHEVVLVVTVPDRPKGRGQCCEPGPVKAIAIEKGLRLIQPEKIKDPEARQALLEASPDILAVVCYGEYIPESIYNAPPERSINVHPSLLPRWRGSSPIYYTLLAGDTMGGVTVQYLHKKMDAGDILLQIETPIDPNENHGQLSDRLYRIGGGLLIEAVDGLQSRTIVPQIQDESLATKAPKIEKSDLWLKWNEPAIDVRNRIRAFAPVPGAKSQFRGVLCKLLSASRDLVKVENMSEPGTIVSLIKDGPVVACLDSCLCITGIQPAGKKALNGKDFLNGYHPKIGERFEYAFEEGTT
jgi:methionyl-tRNA formyltransferase